MSQETTTKKINKTSGELDSLVRKSRRKLLELEVMLSAAEIKKGRFEEFSSARELFRKLK